jgi:hypothetical protein
MDVSTFGTTFAQNVYTQQVYHDNGDLSLNASKGSVLIDATTSIIIGDKGVMTTIKGDFTIEGNFYNTGSTSTELPGFIDSIEANSLTVNGASTLQGSVDLNGALDVGGSLDLGGYLQMSNGNLQIESTSSLDNTASAHYFMLGDGNEGSWRIGVSSDNKLQFQRHNGSIWITVNQMGP